MRSLFVMFALVAAVSAGTGYFWHITDMHLQTSYKKGGVVSDKCRGSGGKAGKFGDYGSCDMPMTTVKAVAQFIIDQSNNLGIIPNFVLWTGDIMSGREKDKSVKSLDVHLTNWTNLLKNVNTHFNGKVRIFPVLGNHDAAPTQHEFPDDSNCHSYVKTYELWKGFLTEDAHASLKKGGYYTQLIAPGLRFLGINTAMYFVDNDSLKVDKSKDPVGQFAWLENVLATARANGEKVIIGSHLAPGKSAGAGNAMYDAWSDRLIEIMDGYHKDVIVAGFYGHNHCESYHIINDISGDKKDCTIHWMAGSGTAAGNLNPSISLVKFSTEDPFTILDRTVYYFNLKTANSEGKITWKQMYQTTSEYGISDLSTANMLKLTDKLSNYTSSEWKKFAKHLYQDGPDHSVSESAHKTRMCVIRHAYSSDYKASCK